MEQLQLENKNIPSDLATVGRYINSFAGTYMVVTGHLVRYQSKNRGLNLEIEIESLSKHEDFNASFTISPEKLKNLSALSKGKNDVIFSLYKSRKSYLITNQNSKIDLEHVDVSLMMPLIGESLTDVEKVGPPIEISSRHELGMTGREKTTTLVLRDDTFTGIINSAGEYFFEADHYEETGAITALPQSCFFLKIGKEQFTLKLYRKENCHLLLTEVSIGTGIKCRMLETLTKL